VHNELSELLVFLLEIPFNYETRSNIYSMDLPPPIAFLMTLPQFSNPFGAMWYIIAHGGWFIILLTLLIGLWELWVHEVGEHFEHKNFKYILLAINVPKSTEQTVKSVENLFSSLMGLHVSINSYEKYVEGRQQENFSCEIASHAGLIQFYMRVPIRTRDVFEAAIFAQYPDAEIKEAEDYTQKYPLYFPNDEWDCWGTELVTKKSQCWPIKTYVQFEDKLSGTFKDPLAQLYEVMATLGPGEELWVQYPIKPIEQDWQVECQNEALKMIGVTDFDKKKKANPVVNLLDNVVRLAHVIIHSAFHGVHPPAVEVGKKSSDKPRSQILYLSPRENELVKAVELKSGKLGYKSKIRLLYVAKKEIAKKNRKKVVTGIMGVFRQFNAHDMNTFGLGKHTFVRAYYYFVQYRLNRRKRILMRAYKGRSNSRGDKNYILSVDELATIWHFPMEDLSAPLLKKAEMRKGEPPTTLPMSDFEHTQQQKPAPPSAGEGIPTNLPFA